MENPIEIDDFGVPLFSETPISLRIQLCPKDPGFVLLQSYDHGDGMDDL